MSVPEFNQNLCSYLVYSLGKTTVLFASYTCCFQALIFQFLTSKLYVLYLCLSDFNKQFDRWDRGGTDKVKTEILDGYLGPDLPDKSVLEKIDENHDGLFSREELGKAFGFEFCKYDCTRFKG